MNRQRLDQSIDCQGLTIRTTNADEMTAGTEKSTAKIGNLWEDFQTKIAPNMDKSSQVYGIYHNYESDVNGAFNVTAAMTSSQSNNDNINVLDMVSIPKGDYFVCRKQGDMPQVVIDAWSEVWTYFNSVDCAHTRKYDIDFEKYIGSDTVEVWISIED